MAKVKEHRVVIYITPESFDGHLTEKQLTKALNEKTVTFTKGSVVIQDCHTVPYGTVRVADVINTDKK